LAGEIAGRDCRIPQHENFFSHFHSSLLKKLRSLTVSRFVNFAINYRHSFLFDNKKGIMKPVYEFLLACLLVFIAGCSAIAGIFNAGVWTAVIAITSVTGLLLLLRLGTRK
jgi:hypothetical protein